ncbi:hypothetical protein F4808DRAFT_464802 [Astrocystis sublimbata]|nr:hypothetical protein F4808DRAFT_464802 [Astrocystis sublimbata]
MATRQSECYASLSITFAAATVSLICRLWARKLKRLSLSLDDYLAIIAFLSALVYNTASYVWLCLGLGLRFEDVSYSLEEIGRFSSLIHFIVEHSYTFSIAASQLSLLSLFLRIFSPVNTFRYSVYTLTAATMVWFLIRLFLVTFQCNPPRYMWDKTVEGSCHLDTGEFFTGTVAAHMFLDLCLMVLPAWQIRKLVMPPLHRFGIAAMFMFSIVVCVSSIMMIIEGQRYSKDPNERLWNEVGPIIWSGVEINLSLVTVRPVVLATSRKISSMSFKTTARSPSQLATDPNSSLGLDNISWPGHRYKTGSTRELLDTDVSAGNLRVEPSHKLFELPELICFSRKKTEASTETAPEMTTSSPMPTGLLGPLTTQFIPPGSCVSQSLTIIRYRSDSSADYNYYLTAGPGVSTCFPSSRFPASGLYYSPGRCPSDYVEACTMTGGNSFGNATETTVNCCPRMPYSFACNSDAVGSDWGIFADCTTSVATLEVDSDFFAGLPVSKSSEITVATNSKLVLTSAVINGYAIQVRWQETDEAALFGSQSSPTASATSTSNRRQSPTSTPTSMPTSMPTVARAGTIAGIVIGSVAGAVLLVGVVLLLIRSKRKKLGRQTHIAGPTTDAGTVADKQHGIPAHNGGPASVFQKQELPVHARNGVIPRQELFADSPAAAVLHRERVGWEDPVGVLPEFDATERPRELQADLNRPELP